MIRSINVPINFVSGEGSSWLADGCLLAVSYIVERDRALVSSSSYKGTNLIRGLHTHDLI